MVDSANVTVLVGAGDSRLTLMFKVRVCAVAEILRVPDIDSELLALTDILVGESDGDGVGGGVTVVVAVSVRKSVTECDMVSHPEKLRVPLPRVTVTAGVNDSVWLAESPAIVAVWVAEEARAVAENEPKAETETVRSMVPWVTVRVGVRDSVVEFDGVEDGDGVGVAVRGAEGVAEGDGVRLRLRDGDCERVGEAVPREQLRD